MAEDVITDVVGAQEAHEILSVELQRISRWRKIGKLPPPYADLRLSPVWVRADIERVRELGADGLSAPRRERFLSPELGEAAAKKALAQWRKALADWCEQQGFTLPPEEPPLLGTAEAAALLEVDKSQIPRWRKYPTKSGPPFPDPAARISAGPLWLRSAVEQFANLRADQRIPRPPKQQARAKKGLSIS